MCCIGHGEKNRTANGLNDNGNAMLREKTLPGGQSNNRALTVWPLLPLLIDCRAAVGCGKGVYFSFFYENFSAFCACVCVFVLREEALSHVFFFLKKTIYNPIMFMVEFA